MKLRIMGFVILLTCIVSYCNVFGLTPAPHISGVISLPDGKVAPEGGIHLRVVLQSENDSISKEFVIGEGENSITYGIANLNVGYEFTVRCELVTPVEGYSDVSYYVGDNSEGPFECFAKKLYQPNSYSNIDITLLETKKVKGTLLLPEGVSVNNDSKVTVNVIARSEPKIVADSDPIYYLYFEKEAETFIRKGENAGEFEIELPVYKQGYYFNYRLNDYISGVCPDSKNFDTRIDITDDTYVSIQLEKGNVIKGKVILPDNETAKSGGYPLTVSAVYFTTHLTIAGNVQLPNYIDKKVIIPEGKNSVDYEITVYPKYSEYYVLYSIEGKECIDKGYYSPTGILNELDKDVCKIKVESDVEDINLCLMKGAILSGSIIYFYDQARLLEVNGYLSVISDGQVVKKSPFTVKSGSIYADFEIVIPYDLKDFVIKYETISNGVYPANSGYYGENGTTVYISEAKKFDAGKDSLSNLQFLLLGFEKVSGTVKLPDGLEELNQPEIFEITVLDMNDDGSNPYKYSTLCTLNPNETEKSFIISVPECFENVVVYCSHLKNPDSNTPLFIDGYLGPDGMVADKEDALLLNPKEPNAKNIKIVPIVAKYGDLNGDLLVNSIDLAYLKAYLLGIQGSNGLKLYNADVNMDGEINSIDLAWLKKYILGIIDELPVLR